MTKQAISDAVAGEKVHLTGETPWEGPYLDARRWRVGRDVSWGKNWEGIIYRWLGFGINGLLKMCIKQSHTQKHFPSHHRRLHSFSIDVVLKTIYIHFLKVIHLYFMTFAWRLPRSLLKEGFPGTWKSWFSTVFGSKRTFTSSCSSGKIIFRRHAYFHCGRFTVVLRNIVFPHLRQDQLCIIIVGLMPGNNL